jgi:hypothetical protein
MGKYHHPQREREREREREQAPNVIDRISNIGLKKNNLSRCKHSQLHLNEGKHKNKMKK